MQLLDPAFDTCFWHNTPELVPCIVVRLLEVTNSWTNNGDASDLGRHRAHYDVILMAVYPCQSLQYSSTGLSHSMQYMYANRLPNLLFYSVGIEFYNRIVD